MSTSKLSPMSVYYNPDKPACLKHGYGHWTKDCEVLMSTSNTQISDCCSAPISVNGLGDFHDNDRAVTMCYVCSKCQKVCDLLSTSNTNVPETSDSDTSETSRIVSDTSNTLAENELRAIIHSETTKAIERFVKGLELPKHPDGTYKEAWSNGFNQAISEVKTVINQALEGV